MAYYYTCPSCGSNLDPGEMCTCQDESEEQKRLFAESTRVNPATGQMSFVWDEEETSNRAEADSRSRKGFKVARRFGGIRGRLCG